MQIELTPSAQARISGLIDASGNPRSVFRIMVDGGGCQGLSYRMQIDDGATEDDISIVMPGLTVAVDGMSVAFLHGTTLDWVEDINGDRFEVRNPNATSTCGCGTSFGV